MRITSGKVKNSKLDVPEAGVRPLTDRIKTSLFDLIRPYLDKANVLDLFAGSGGFGIEALSRGAAMATFVDSSADSIAAISNNLEHTGLSEAAIIVNSDVLTFLEAEQGKFNIIILDAPFPMPVTEKEHNLRLAAKLLLPEGVLIFRYPKTELNNYKSVVPAGTEKVYEKRYGKSIIAFFRS
jgi:16S rRNA (guanine966-N2)-methyltransferase